jgi:hypothetical protein
MVDRRHRVFPEATLLVERKQVSKCSTNHQSMAVYAIIARLLVRDRLPIVVDLWA